MEWTSPAPSTLDVVDPGDVPMTFRSVPLDMDVLCSTRLPPTSVEAPDAWTGPLAYHRLRGRTRRPLLHTVSDLLRYGEPALVPVAAAIWLHVLALTARSL